MKSVRGVSWKRFLSIVNACRLVSEFKDLEPGAVLPLLCTLEHPSLADPSKRDYHLIFPLPRGYLEDLCQTDASDQKWAEQLTEQWLVSQCSRMAASLYAIHQVAALKTSDLPRLLFLRSVRLATNMIYWVSPSETQLGALVLGNLCQDPPGAYESAPEYSFAQKKSSTARSDDYRSSIRGTD